MDTRALRLFTAAFCCIAALLLPGAPGALGKPDKKPSAVADHDRDEAINRGVRYLEDTVLRLPDASGTPRKQFTVALTGLVELMAGSARGIRTDGKSRIVDRCRAYLAAYVEEVERRSADESQLPPRHGMAMSDRIMQYTWPLGTAAFFYGELHARGRHKKSSRKLLRRIAKVLGETQQTDGGWGHGRVQSKQTGEAPGGVFAGMQGGYPSTLLAATNGVAAPLALARTEVGAKGLGFLERVIPYYETAQLPNGNFPYDPSQRSAHRDLTGVSRAAGALFSLYCLGVPWKHPTMKRSLSFVDEHVEYLSEGHGSSAYNLMWAALAQRVRGEEPWKRFKRTFFRRILDKQDEQGAFECICAGKAFASTNDSRGLGLGIPRFAGGTKAYVTALHTFILLLDRDTPRLLEKRPAERRPRPTTPR